MLLRSVLRGCVGVALAVVCGARPADAANFPIDDFEVVDVDFRVIAPGTFAQSQPIPPPFSGHVISPFRKIVMHKSFLAPTNAHPEALLSAGTEVNDRLYLDVWQDTFIALEYQLSPAGQDLAAGGLIDRIELETFPYVSDPGGDLFVTLQLVDSSGDTASSTLFAWHDFEPQVLTWTLGYFDGTDLAHITSVRFVFEPVASGGRGRKHIGDIRLRGAGSRATNFYENVLFTAAPPFPTPPLRIDVRDSVTRGGFGSLYELQVALQDASAGFAPAMALEWNSAPMLEGAMGEMSLRWTDAAPFQQVDVELSVDFAPPGTRLQYLYPPDPIHGAQSLLLPLQTEMAAGRLQPSFATSEGWMTLDVHPSQSLEFASVSVTENPGFPVGNAGVTIHFTLIPVGPVDVMSPLVTASWFSDVTPMGTSAVPVPPSAAAADIRLAAIPSITRAGTFIQISRPLEGASALLVHDAAGRRIRELPIGRGERGIHWDGADQRGRPAPAGVYFVRLVDNGGPTTRIVRVR